ncbi:hypothetical protein [Rhodococcus sp. NPDC003348]
MSSYGEDGDDEQFDDIDTSALVTKPAQSVADDTEVGDGQTPPPVVKVRVGNDRIWKRFSELNTGTLQGRPTNFSDPVKVEHAAQRIRDAEADKADQENLHRERFFGWAIGAVTFTLLGNFGVIGFYFWSQWSDISEPVMLAWISATVVEVLGIAYIIATHLFKDGSRSK